MQTGFSDATALPACPSPAEPGGDVQDRPPGRTLVSHA